MVTRKYTNVMLYHDGGDIDKEVECYGDAADEKPTDVPNTTVFYEMDTGAVYMYSVGKGAWIKQAFG